MRSKLDSRVEKVSSLQEIAARKRHRSHDQMSPDPPCSRLMGASEEEEGAVQVMQPPSHSRSMNRTVSN